MTQNSCVWGTAGTVRGRGDAAAGRSASATHLVALSRRQGRVELCEVVARHENVLLHAWDARNPFRRRSLGAEGANSGRRGASRGGAAGERSGASLRDKQGVHGIASKGRPRRASAPSRRKR